MAQRQQQQQHKVSNYDTSRRVFRGRNGATDRTTIPDKSIILSKRKPKKYTPETTETPEVLQAPVVISNYYESDLIIDNGKPYTGSGSSNNNDDEVNNNNNSHDNTDSPENCQAVTIQLQQQQQKQKQTSIQQSITDITTTTTTTTTTSPTTNYIKNNINKLLHRIGNVRRSIQNSSTATLSQSNVYKENVIFAVQNCCITWSNLLLIIILNQNESHTSTIQQQEQELEQQQEEHIENDSRDITTTNNNNNDNNEWITTVATKVALQLFTVIQLSLQCGPLHGCKPGYFKRCGYDICYIVLQYLQTIQHYYYCNRNKNNNNTRSNNNSHLVDEQHHHQQQQQVKSDHSQENGMNNTVLDEAETESLVHMHHVNDSKHDIHEHKITSISNDIESNLGNSTNDNTGTGNSVSIHRRQHRNSSCSEHDDNRMIHYNDNSTCIRTIESVNATSIQDDIENDNDDDDTTSDDDNDKLNVLANKNNAADDNDDDDDDTDEYNSDDDDDIEAYATEAYATTGISDNDDNNNQADCTCTNQNTTRPKNERYWDYLYFTTKQIQTIDKWIHDCNKKITSTTSSNAATTALLLPSRHIQGLQYQGVQNTIKNKQRRQKKQQQKNNAVEIAKKKNEYIIPTKTTRKSRI